MTYRWKIYLAVKGIRIAIWLMGRLPVEEAMQLLLIEGFKNPKGKDK